MQRRHRGEDDPHLAHWVDAVVRRWAARGLPPAQRLVLFRHLLARLTLARTATGSTADLTTTDPETYADTIGESPTHLRPQQDRGAEATG